MRDDCCVIVVRLKDPYRRRHTKCLAGHMMLGGGTERPPSTSKVLSILYVHHGVCGRLNSALYTGYNAWFVHRL